MPYITYTIKEQNIEPLRLDRFISENLKILSRSQIRARSLKANVNGKNVKLSHIVKTEDVLDLYWDDAPAADILPEDIPLEIIWEDENCIVINKNQGLVVHPGAGNRQGTLANALYYRMLQKGSGQNADIVNRTRAGIVHRLDKETSGVIIAAWNEKTHAFLSNQFKTKKVKKEYIAIVRGTPKETGRIETYIKRDTKDRKLFSVADNGKQAVTFYKVIERWQNHSLLLLIPETGRTHQLRVHLRHLGNPILGDPLYGSKDSQFPKATLMLHSKSLQIKLPNETEERVFTSPIPGRFRVIINKLKKTGNANG